MSRAGSKPPSCRVRPSWSRIFRSNPLFEPEVPESHKPFIVGRARFGRITIANSDAGGAAYTDAAIDQGHRAVMELLHAEKA